MASSATNMKHARAWVESRWPNRGEVTQCERRGRYGSTDVFGVYDIFLLTPQCDPVGIQVCSYELGNRGDVATRKKKISEWLRRNFALGASPDTWVVGYRSNATAPGLYAWGWDPFRCDWVRHGVVWTSGQTSGK